MPYYEFKTKEDKSLFAFKLSHETEVGKWYWIDDPDLGKKVRAKRVMSIGQSPNAQPVWKPYTSMRLPRFMKGQPCDSEGRVQVNTQAQEREIMAQGGYERE